MRLRNFITPTKILTDIQDWLDAGAQILIGDSLVKPPRNMHPIRDRHFTWKYAELRWELDGPSFGAIWVIAYKPPRVNYDAWRAGLTIPEAKIFICEDLLECGCLGCHERPCKGQFAEAPPEPTR